jgi:hypothetical protein
LFGVEPARLELDLEMSPEVSAVLPALCADVLEELARIGCPARPVDGARMAG